MIFHIHELLYVYFLFFNLSMRSLITWTCSSIEEKSCKSSLSTKLLLDFTFIPFLFFYNLKYIKRLSMVFLFMRSHQLEFLLSAL
jgi:hypothetical protein